MILYWNTAYMWTRFPQWQHQLLQWMVSAVHKNTRNQMKNNTKNAFVCCFNMWKEVQIFKKIMFLIYSNENWSKKKWIIIQVDLLIFYILSFPIWYCIGTQYICERDFPSVIHNKCSLWYLQCRWWCLCLYHCLAYLALINNICRIQMINFLYFSDIKYTWRYNFLLWYSLLM